MSKNFFHGQVLCPTWYLAIPAAFTAFKLFPWQHCWMSLSALPVFKGKNSGAVIRQFWIV